MGVLDKIKGYCVFLSCTANQTLQNQLPFNISAVQQLLLKHSL